MPVSAARLVLPAIIPRSSPPIPTSRLEVIAEDNFVDVIAAACDAGIRYDERLEQDMIAVPIGPRVQRFATAASPAYLDRRGRPQHPRELLGHACLRNRFPSGTMAPWEFERDGEAVLVDPTGPLIVRAGGATDLASTLPSRAPASSMCSRTGYGRISKAARSNPFSSRGGSVSPDRSSTTPAAASYPRRCARLWIL